MPPQSEAEHRVGQQVVIVADDDTQLGEENEMWEGESGEIKSVRWSDGGPWIKAGWYYTVFVGEGLDVQPEFAEANVMPA